MMRSRKNSKRAGTTPYKRAPLGGHGVVPALWTVFTSSGGGSEWDRPGIRNGFNLVIDEIHGGTAMGGLNIERDISSGEESMAATLGGQRGVHSNEEKEHLD